MPRYRKKPVIITADRWFENGDHPQDYATPEERARGWEGRVVRYHRSPVGSGLSRGSGVEPPCSHCGRSMADHGFIDTLEGGHIVCPGDFIITGVQGERYPCKPDIFAATYEAVDE